MTLNIDRFDKMTVNGKYHFRTESSQVNNLNDDTCVKVWKKNRNGMRVPVFGWIQQIFRHHVPSGVSVDFLYVEWGKRLKETTSTGLSQVKLDVRGVRKHPPVIFVNDIVPYNVVLLPANIEKVWEDQGDTFVVIDYVRKLGSYKPK